MIDLYLVWGEFFVLIFTMLGLAVHEAGHALAGYWVGLPPRLVQIGSGPTLLRRRIFGATVVVSLFPSSGYAIALASPSMTPQSRAVVTAGGSAANLLLLGLALSAYAIWPDADIVFIPLILTQIGFCVSSVVPFKFFAGGRWRRSDGLQFVNFMRGKLVSFDAGYRAAIAPVFPKDIPLDPPSSDAPELLFNLQRPDRLNSQFARRDAVEGVARLLDAGRLTPPERSLALYFLLGIELSYADTGISDQRMSFWSLEAMRVVPESAMIPAAVLLTRAGVLARLGDGAQAEEILRVLQTKLRLSESIVRCNVYMAQAVALQGRRNEVETWLAQARAAASGPSRKALLRMIRRAEARAPLAAVKPLVPEMGSAT